MNRRDFIRASGAAAAAALSAVPGAAPAGAADPPAKAPAAPKPAPRFGDGRDWWFQKRFGMFVHWGLYAIHGWHEQDQWRRRIPRAEYVKLAQ
jgi:alpha-L-fucosidase